MDTCVVEMFTTIATGVQQGSALGPTLFSPYIAPLSSVVLSFGLEYHKYADDTHIYTAASKNRATSQGHPVR
jgi:Reverse transcriptase (RNA-dependent DNA polymerase)